MLQICPAQKKLPFSGNPCYNVYMAHAQAGKKSPYGGVPDAEKYTVESRKQVDWDN